MTNGATHAFDAPGDHQRRFVGTNRTRGNTNRIHARTAQAIDGAARHRDRQTREQQRHASDVAIVFAGLIRAAVDHIGNRSGIEILIALKQRAQRHRTEIIGTHTGQRARIAADRRAHGITDKSFSHGRMD